MSPDMQGSRRGMVCQCMSHSPMPDQPMYDLSRARPAAQLISLFQVSHLSSLAHPERALRHLLDAASALCMQSGALCGPLLHVLQSQVPQSGQLCNAGGTCSQACLRKHACRAAPPQCCPRALHNVLTCVGRACKEQVGASRELQAWNWVCHR